MRKAHNPAVKFMHCLPAIHDPNTVVGRGARHIGAARLPKLPWLSSRSTRLASFRQKSPGGKVLRRGGLGTLPCAGQRLVHHRDNQRDADRDCECGGHVHASHVPGR